MKRKWLAVGIILLLAGVTILPSINHSVVKASSDDDLVEVTIQACGIKGYKDTTVNLTKEQYQNIEQYLMEFRARLNQTSTKEEAAPIFKEAVIELNKHGLLPKGMSVERAQELILGKKLYPSYKFIEERLNIGRTHTPDNAFCFIFTKLYTWENQFVLHIPLPILLLGLLGFKDIMYLTGIFLTFIPIMISIFSVDVISGGYKSVQTLGIYGNKTIISYNDIMLSGFVGLKIWNSFSDDKDGFLVGWTVAIYENPFENSTYYQKSYK